MGGKTIQLYGFRRADNADKVKNLLERVAGAGTVYAAILRHPRNISATSRPFAIVQFQTEAHASLLQYQAQRNVLRIGGYHLKLRIAEHDIVPRPRTTIFTLHDATLHFGCPLSETVMSVLWTGRRVSVEFGFGMEKIYFYMLHDSKKYKLEISYESIREIQLYRPPSPRSLTKSLLIEVRAAPKIYEPMPCCSGLMYEDPRFNYFRDEKDDQWTRTTDFSPLASIGQSYILCLEVPYQCGLPNIGDYFVYYREHNSDFLCWRGYPYSCHNRFVPVVKSHRYTDIPYEILFTINRLVQNGILSGPTLNDNFFRLVSPSFQCIEDTKLALEKLLYHRKTCLNPTSWLSEQYSIFQRSRSRITLPNISLDDDDGLVRVYKVQVTPAKMYFCGPEINVSNRVIRHYAADLENFLRISFLDEDFEKLRSADIAPRSAASRRTALYDRILSAVDVPALHHMVNCVVFPQQGPRPHPNECSGSDLDGDIYFVSWDPDLIPTCMVAPMDYTPAPTEILDHDVEMEEVHEYFADYIVNESLGMIANAHVVFADKDPFKAESAPCIELAKLFSIAVDFPKTGVPAKIPPHLHVKEYPDFMEKHDRETYASKGVIGKLYREIKWHNPLVYHFTKDVARISYDADLIVDGYQYHIQEAVWFKEEYDFKLGNLMDHYGIKTEAEIISGCVLMIAKNFSRSTDAEAIASAVSSLQEKRGHGLARCMRRIGVIRQPRRLLGTM
uniref:Uncharacterized protein n=1 Tax=Avena sativa TaxID=4498 RepID=A0ACD5YGG1_AVESA